MTETQATYETGRHCKSCVYEYPCCDCMDGSKFRAKDTIKKNNHDVDVDEMVRGKALKKALEIINGERQDSYGNPEDSFQLIADYWTCYLESVGAGTGQMIKPRQVAEMMALFKIARMSGQKTTADNYADCAGYIGIAGDML